MANICDTVLQFVIISTITSQIPPLTHIHKHAHRCENQRVSRKAPASAVYLCHEWHKLDSGSLESRSRRSQESPRGRSRCDVGMTVVALGVIISECHS